MQGAWFSANSKHFKCRVENSEPFSNFGAFPILCWRVGTFQNSVHATKQLLHKASQCGSYFCTFRSQTLKFLFKKKSYEHWDCCPLSLSERRQSLSSMSLLEFVKIWQHCHKVTKSLNHLSLWMLMHLYYLCVHLCICLCLLVVYAKPPHSDQFLDRWVTWIYAASDFLFCKKNVHIFVMASFKSWTDDRLHHCKVFYSLSTNYPIAMHESLLSVQGLRRSCLDFAKTSNSL